MEHHELREQKKVVRFLTIQQTYGRVLKFTSIPNSTFTNSWSELNRIQASGLNPGLLDLFILLPKMQVWLEMKRPRRILKDGSLGSSPSKTSLEQIQWITLLNQYPNTKAAIAYGADEAIKFLTELIGDVSYPKTTDEERNKGIAEFSSFIQR